MTDNNTVIELLTAIVSTIESNDKNANQAKSELMEQLKIIASKTDTISTNFPKLIETMSNFDSKVASSFEDVENVSTRLNRIIEQVDITEKALLSVQKQTQNLRLDETTQAINNAGINAQKLNQILKSTSTDYTTHMNNVTEFALSQIRKLNDEIDTISKSFANIVSNHISKKVISDVSQKLTKQLITDLQAQIETGAKETAQKLTETSFKIFDSTLLEVKKDIQSSAKTFHDEVASTYKYDADRFKKTSEVAEESHKIYMQREKAYQAHVNEEKAVIKRNWFAIGIGAWLLFMATIIAVDHLIKGTTASVIDEATGYVTLQNDLKNIGFRTTSKEFCNGFLPKQKFDFYNRPKVSFCYLINKDPIYQVQTDYGYLMIFGQ